MLMCHMSHRVTCHIVSHVTTHCRYVSMGAAWVVALKQWLKKKWEEARDLWNLLFSDPTRARIIVATFAFVFVAAVITMVVLLQTQSFQSLPVPAPPPLPPPGRPCPWTLPCKRATDVVYVKPPHPAPQNCNTLGQVHAGTQRRIRVPRHCRRQQQQQAAVQMQGRRVDAAARLQRAAVLRHQGQQPVVRQWRRLRRIRHGVQLRRVLSPADCIMCIRWQRLPLSRLRL